MMLNPNCALENLKRDKLFPHNSLAILIFRKHHILFIFNTHNEVLMRNSGLIHKQHKTIEKQKS